MAHTTRSTRQPARSRASPPAGRDSHAGDGGGKTYHQDCTVRAHLQAAVRRIQAAQAASPQLSPAARLRVHAARRALETALLLPNLIVSVGGGEKE